MSFLRPVFVGSIFLGAFLLFLVQPYAARLLLPRFGGSPAVWNTALVFFQTVLLVGYLYAHGVSRLPRRAQVALHLPVLAVPLLLLPPALPAFDTVASAWPALGLLWILAGLVGLPFFVLSSNSSLIQHWWAEAGHPGSDDPYWLYGASNLGSLLALVAYPFLVEPALDLEAQGLSWTLGYGLFVLLTAAAMITAYRAPRPLATGPMTAPPGDVAPVPDTIAGEARGSRDKPVTAWRRTLWVVRAAVGTSLLLSVTMRITTDVASVPLFWVVPLAIYLVTFILAFGFTDRVTRRPIASLAATSIVLATGLLLVPLGFSFGAIVTVNLSALFFGALLCHRDLAADRPGISHLTGFYLWISFGGALGGMLNSLLAPLIFDSVAEYPLTLIAVAVLLHVVPEHPRPLAPYRPNRRTGIVMAAALVLPLALAFPADAVPVLRASVVSAFAILWGLALARYVGFVALSVVLVAGVSFGLRSGTAEMLAEERSFFGVVRVEARGDTVSMVHGTTVHGTQIRNPEPRLAPGGYYHAEGPMGSMLLDQAPGATIGVVGLGAGSLAGLLQPGQRLVYHEIDPLVERMARAHFTYLEATRGDVSIILGDGRLTLEDVPDGTYDLLVIDAFSSDFVPTHLLTVEALELYRTKVRPGGLVVLHISNVYADLQKVVKGYSVATGQPVAHVLHRPSPKARGEGGIASRAAAISPDPAVVRALLERPAWGTVPDEVEAVIWTDARVDLPAVLW